MGSKEIVFRDWKNVNSYYAETVHLIKQSTDISQKADNVPKEP